MRLAWRVPIPLTTIEALEGDYGEEWQGAMDKEVGPIIENGTFKSID